MAAPLTVLFSGRFDADERERWWRELRAAAPEFDWRRDGDGSALDRAAVDAAVVANPGDCDRLSGGLGAGLTRRPVSAGAGRRG